MSSSKQKPAQVTESTSSVDRNNNEHSEVFIKFLWWFVIHIKNPNPHTLEIVKRVLKFCEFLIVSVLIYLLIKGCVFLVR